MTKLAEAALEKIVKTSIHRIPNRANRSGRVF